MWSMPKPDDDQDYYKDILNSDLYIEVTNDIASRAKEQVKRYLPSPDDLPTTKKDKELALRNALPLSTTLSKVGVFTTDEEQLIKQYKQKAQENWIENQVKVLEDILMSGRKFK